jgi:lipid II:glycine glycyltransferase (peptidoglycan interpeptide bridge formation enzyme)
MENYNENILKLRVREQKLKEELEYWETEFKPSGNMGKWGRQTKLDKLKTELDEIQSDIGFHDSLYLSNEIYKQWKDENLTN